jgi:hypothetical protein
MRNLIFDNLIIPLEVLNQALGRLHLAGWSIEHIAWSAEKKEALVVGATLSQAASMAEVVWRGEEIE